MYPIQWKFNPFAGSTYILPNAGAKHTSIVLLHGSEVPTKSPDAKTYWNS